MKLLALIFIVLTMALMVSATTVAQEKATNPELTTASSPSVNLNGIGACVGAGLVLIGAAYGIGRLADSALQAGSRQPETAAQTRTTAIILAALVEGATFFALAICIIVAVK